MVNTAYVGTDSRLILGMFTKEILPNPDKNCPKCHCASIALTPDGGVLVAWYAYPQEETRGGVLVFTRRGKGTKKFSTAKTIPTGMTNSLGNPVLFLGENGRLHLLFVSLRGHYWDSAVLYQMYSDDLGERWSAPESLRLPDGAMVRHPPIVRNNTYLLLPTYDEKTNETVLLTAGPDAQGWMDVERFDGVGAIQGAIVRQGEKQLAMLLRPAGDRHVCLRSISGDDGRTWSRVMPTPLPNPLSGVAAFQADDAFCAIYNHTEEHQRYPLSLSYSTDRGTSWSDPRHIDETEQEVSYPSFTVDSSGVAHGVYTFGRDRIRYVSFDAEWWRP